ncbi:MULTISPECIES: acyltransferase [unclassified Streptomyces]|uniref:acyltransferase family protein n=1 Tax=Streptomyces TaxID=1883 RepID=UPI0002DC65EA|nr:MULTISPECIES: acyltransferase [unclassified Streptomyces]MYR70554.1 acyltransferase [Streptomyces sp. SID4939]MYR99654.1 acyltransferase [Streptomyces sp. SID4940]MYT64239.1 acyltransferase [Streptomyces sp. SID8357]MYT87052.1 acyltransferase [Streptomyces sp. SID8360]MYU34500.1 acyltransferase [Streptomyces sp. SID8358]MYW37385.1 acyltransferase [Streptomyces sp. SID1]MYX72073.1 acyltransferase [Streptomyces sp. SID3915]
MRWSHGSVAECFSGRNNSLGILRLSLAAAVVVSHASVLGFGDKEFGHHFSHGQTDLGKLSVYGFFVLSGILVTRSGNRLPLGRFLWHRALRLLPGLWVCLAVTAFVVAPFLYWRQQGGLDGFWGHSRGPWDYLASNWAVAPRQKDVSGVVATAGDSGLAHSPSIDAALWSLRYEVLCYIGVALLAVTGALARARRVVLLLTAVLGLLIVRDAVGDPFWAGFSDSDYYASVQFFEVTGQFDPDTVLYLAFAFALGSVIELYRERVPVSDVLGVTSGLVLIGSLRFGYLFVVGLPAFAYLLLWLAIRLPAPFRRVGARHDYSYGMYIYGFVVQQSLVAIGFARWGFWPYLAMSLAGALAAAVLSWHLVERPAMRLKNLGSARTSPPKAGGGTAGPVPEAAKVPEAVAPGSGKDLVGSSNPV